MKSCTVDGCTANAPYADGMCGKHHYRMENRGTTDDPVRPSVNERLIVGIKEQDSGCKVWTGATIRGYGVMRVGGRRNAYTHRIAYSLFVGEIPDGMLVCHKCDNPPCCNPDHLFLGTDDDNQKDSKRKGRNQRGEQHAHAKLSDADVSQIRREYTPRQVTFKMLGEQFGIGPSTVCKIIKNKRRSLTVC